MEQFLKNSVISKFIDTHPDAKSHLLKKIREGKSEVSIYNVRYNARKKTKSSKKNNMLLDV